MSIPDLDPERILAEIAREGGALGAPLTVALETGSTNDDAKAAAAAGAPHGAAFIADTQRRGRGRGSHAWHSPPGENLYLSIVLRPRLAAADIAPITLAVGLAVARTAARFVAEPGEVAVKWPNDVLVRDRKIAGVLVEGQLRGERAASLVAGVGLNVNARAFPPELAARATSLALEGSRTLDRALIAAALLVEVGRAVSAYEARRLAPMIDELRALDWLRGREVEIAGTRGVAEGIDDAGRLLVRAAGGALTPLVSGEVSVTSDLSSR